MADDRDTGAGAGSIAIPDLDVIHVKQQLGVG
jgi:hypothetical protein